MSRGKNLSLEEARRTGELARFCEEHPSKAECDRFLALLDAMSRGALEEVGTSQPEHEESFTDTQTHRGT
jgi:hypothetical protein